MASSVIFCSKVWFVYNPTFLSFLAQSFICYYGIHSLSSSQLRSTAPAPSVTHFRAILAPAASLPTGQVFLAMLALFVRSPLPFSSEMRIYPCISFL